MTHLAALRTASLLSIIAVVTPYVSAQSHKDKQAEFKAVLERVKQSDPSVDFAHLRMLVTELDSYSTPGSGPSRDKMNAALRSKDYKSALKFAEKDLADNYLDIDAQIGAMAAADKLGDDRKAAHHRYVAKGIIDSILSSGDGKAPATAYKVIAVREEYAVLMALGLRPQSQGLNHIDGHHYDVLTAIDPKTNESRTLYFNIDPIWAAETKLFSK